jgi:hypothetical protein
MMKIKSEFPDEVKVWFPFSLEGSDNRAGEEGRHEKFPIRSFLCSRNSKLTVRGLITIIPKLPNVLNTENKISIDAATGYW